jgi:hypothetical protein
VTTETAVAPEPLRPSSVGARLGIAGALGLGLLALVETAQALLAPTRVPSAANWTAAAREIRAGFQPGDLIVAAPAWADPIMRMHVGDLLPISVAARMDDARFSRVWEIDQRGARALEAAVGTVALERRYGALTVRRTERPAPQITYDFLEQWQDANVTRWEPASRTSTACPWVTDAFRCPATGNEVRRMLVEVDNTIRRAILAPPVMNSVMGIEFPAAALGRELVVAVGLHDTWARKLPGAVTFEVWIAGAPVATTVVDNRSGWRQLHIDTTARDGQQAPVRFHISSPQPMARLPAFAAEARR